MDCLDFLLAIHRLAKDDEFIEIRTSAQTKLATDTTTGKQERFQSEWILKSELENDWPELEEQLHILNEQESEPRNIYYGIQARQRKEGNNDAVNGYYSLWADIDDYDQAIAKLEIVNEFAPPTIVLKSGRGIHVIYCLTYRTNNETGEKLCRALANFFESDSVPDRARILRLPNFHNAKFEHRPMAEVMSYNEEYTYSPKVLEEHLAQWLPLELEPEPETFLPEPTITSYEGLDTIPIRKKMRSLILNGHNPSNKKYASRSEADLAAMIALYRAGCSVDVVRQIFEHHGIGEKVREEGDHYFNVTSEKAQKKVAAHHAAREKYLGENQNPIFEKNNRYWKRGVDNDKIVSTFSIKPRYALSHKKESFLVGDIITQAGKNGNPTTISAQSFTSRRELLRTLGGLRRSFYGTDTDAQFLWDLLTSNEDIETYAGSDYVGFFQDKFVFPGGYITKDGLNEDGISPYIPQSCPLEDHFSLIETEKEEFAKIYSDWVKVAAAFNTADTVWPTLGWFFACYLKFVFSEIGIGFPLLNVTGIRGCGKSTLVMQMMRLMGLPSNSIWSAKITHFAKMKNLSFSNVVPLVVDEFKRDMGEKNIDDWKSLARSSYGGEINARGKADQTMIEYVQRTPLAIIGETPISTEGALVERTIEIKPSRSWLDINEPVAKIALEASQDLKLRTFPLHSAIVALGQDIRKWARDTFREEVRLVTGKMVKPSARICNNMAIVLTGLRFFDMIGEYAKAEVRLGDVSSGEESVIDDMIASRIEDGVVGESARAKVEFDYLLETLDVMLADGVIESGKIFRHDAYEGKLYLDLNACVDLATKWSKYSTRPLRASLTEYKREARELSQIEGEYILSSHERHRIAGVRRFCVVVDAQKTEEALDVGRLITHGTGMLDGESDEVPF